MGRKVVKVEDVEEIVERLLRERFKDTETDVKKVEKIVTELARKRFKGVEINSVKIAEDTDADGDDILRVRVVFTAEDDRLDPNVTSSFIRHLRPKLSKINVHEFPVVSFISQRDIESVAT